MLTRRNIKFPHHGFIFQSENFAFQRCKPTLLEKNKNNGAHFNLRWKSEIDHFYTRFSISTKFAREHEVQLNTHVPCKHGLQVNTHTCTCAHFKTLHTLPAALVLSWLLEPEAWLFSAFFVHYTSASPRACVLPVGLSAGEHETRCRCDPKFLQKKEQKIKSL